MNKLGYLGRTPLGDLYRCKYSGHIALEKWMQFIGSPMPQAPVTEAYYDCALAKQNRKLALSAFNEMDANCNTCQHFKRLESDNAKGSNSASNFVYGNCKSQQSQANKIPYYRDGYQVMVHVADYLGMTCWQPRI